MHSSGITCLAEQDVMCSHGIICQVGQDDMCVCVWRYDMQCGVGCQVNGRYDIPGSD